MRRWFYISVVLFVNGILIVCLLWSCGAKSVTNDPPVVKVQQSWDVDRLREGVEFMQEHWRATASTVRAACAVKSQRCDAIEEWLEHARMELETAKILLDGHHVPEAANSWLIVNGILKSIDAVVEAK